MADAKREREWQALWIEHERLHAEHERLKLERPHDVAAHRALIEKLQHHRKTLVAWRERWGNAL